MLQHQSSHSFKVRLVSAASEAGLLTAREPSKVAKTETPGWRTAKAGGVVGSELHLESHCLGDATVRLTTQHCGTRARAEHPSAGKFD
jgi:hypothetical protein